MQKAVGFLSSTLGKKVLMAITGIILVGFVIGHMAGNMQIYLGAEVLNKYGELLHSNQKLLWAVRLVLLFAVGMALKLCRRRKAG